MILVTTKYVLGITAVCVVAYVVLLLPVLPEISQLSAGVIQFDQALSVVQSWWTSKVSIGEQEAAEAAAAAAEAVVQEKRKRTLLEQKFAMDGPNVGWDSSTITLDYQLAEWVTNDVLDYAWYDWECQNRLEESELLGWNVMVPENLGVVQIDTENKKDDEEDVAQRSSDDDDDEMKLNHWRLVLQQQEQQQSGGEDDEDDSNVSSVATTTSFCIRFMLFNMPKHRQHAMEVTFRQTQLIVSMDLPEGHIQRVDLSTPEPVRVQVQVNGRGRAKVVRDDDDDDNDHDSEDGKEAEPQQESVDHNPTNNDGGEEEEEDEAKSGMVDASLPQSVLTTETVNEEL